jgi:hypothetical protein
VTLERKSARSTDRRALARASSSRSANKNRYIIIKASVFATGAFLF